MHDMFGNVNPNEISHDRLMNKMKTDYSDYLKVMTAKVELQLKWLELERVTKQGQR